MKNCKIKIENENQFNEVIVPCKTEKYQEITIEQLRILAGEKTLMKLTDLTEKQVVHCATKEEAKRICKIAHDNGLKWKNGDSYLDEINFEDYKEETCYSFNLYMYGHLYFYKQENYEIIPSTQITEEPQPEPELKKVWAWDDDVNEAFETYLIKEFKAFERKYLCIYEECIKDFENKYSIDTATYKNISETDPRTPNDVLKIVEKYGKDKLITLIEKL